jgi:hypothetical protein
VLAAAAIPMITASAMDMGGTSRAGRRVDHRSGATSPVAKTIPRGP